MTSYETNYHVQNDNNFLVFNMEMLIDEITVSGLIKSQVMQFYSN